MELIDNMLNQWIKNSIIRNQLRDLIVKAIKNKNIIIKNEKNKNNDRWSGV